MEKLYNLIKTIQDNFMKEIRCPIHKAVSGYVKCNEDEMSCWCVSCRKYFLTCFDWGKPQKEDKK